MVQAILAWNDAEPADPPWSSSRFGSGRWGWVEVGSELAELTHWGFAVVAYSKLTSPFFVSPFDRVENAPRVPATN